MHRTVVGVFAQRISAEATLRRLEMRGFRAECVDGPAMEPPVAADAAPLASSASKVPREFKSRLAWAVRSLSPWSHSPRHGEVFVKVHAGSPLEAQAARDILAAAGARLSDRLGTKWTKWTNWNW